MQAAFWINWHTTGLFQPCQSIQPKGITMNINQFQISNYVKKQIDQYLADHETTLRNAMDNEQQSRELAAILHTGFPKMVQKIYSLAKFEKFFWEKRDPLHEYLAARFTSLEQQAAKKAK